MTRKTQIIPTTEGSVVYISPQEDGPFRLLSADHYKIKLNHFKRSYWIRQEKQGHVTSTFEISRTHANLFKPLDISIFSPMALVSTIAVPIYFLSKQTGSGIRTGTLQEAAIFSTLAIGVGGLAATLTTPGRLYPKKIILPRLIPVITKNKNQLCLTVGEHEFNKDGHLIRVRDYPSLKQLKKGYGYETRDSIDHFQTILKIDMVNDLTDLLSATKYGIDSLEPAVDNTLKLNNWTRSVLFSTTPDELMCRLRMEWSIETLDEMQTLYRASVISYSDMLPFNEEMLAAEDKNLIIRQSFIDAIDDSYKTFIALDSVQSILSSPIPIPLLGAEELTLQTGEWFAKNLGEAVEAVVTIVTKKGHGSGCIVTSDGYVVTNAHVVMDDTANIMAIMGEDVEARIPLRFIRMNEAIDLALLKLDTSGLKPLKLAVENDINTGSDVYAIGTPADLELGQTVTRGIVSGKRKFGGHHVIQTDVGISAGNSGGALISTEGILLGIVTAEMRSRKVDDIGFAIPSHIIESALKIKLAE